MAFIMIWLLLHTRLALHKGVSVWNKWVNAILHQVLARSCLTFFRTITLENYKLHPDAFEVLCEKKAALLLPMLTVVNAYKGLLLQKSNPIVSVCGSLKPNLYQIFPHYRQKDTRERTHAFTYIILILHKACAGGHWYKLLQWATVSLSESWAPNGL